MEVLLLSTASVSEMKACAQAIKDEVQKIENDINNLVESVNQIKDNYRDLKQYDGKLMEDESKDLEVALDGKEVEVTYRLLAHQSSGQEISNAFSGVSHHSTDAKRDCIRKIKQLLEEVNKVADSIKVQTDEVKRSINDKLRSDLTDSGPVGFVGGGGGGSAFIGSLSTPITKAGQKNSNTSSDKAILGNNTNNFEKSSNSNLSDSTSKETTNVSKNADKNPYTEITNSSKSASKGSDSTSNGQKSSSSDLTGKHSGGSFAGSVGYHGDGVKKEESKTDGLLEDAATSIDDIISGKNNNRIASSGMPVLGSKKITGSAVIPVVSGLGAAGASGLGLTALMGKKKDDDDDDLEEADENSFMKKEDILNNQDEKTFKTLEIGRAHV